jgi:hypothetical protein
VVDQFVNEDCFVQLGREEYTIQLQNLDYNQTCRARGFTPVFSQIMAIEEDDSVGLVEMTTEVILKIFDIFIVKKIGLAAVDGKTC